ncbi:MAG: hypothetical protein KDA05_04680 [Phycisphaerales bacterium]|nr:hypothetical protein [Phycisphaerales bacterium]
MKNRPPTRPAQSPARFESLEPRIALSTSLWTGAGGDTLWSNPNNWSGNQTPAYRADVVIDAGRVVVLDQGNPVVASLTLGGRLVVNRAATLNADGPFQLSSDADLRINGLVNWVEGEWAPGAAAVVNAGGRLNIGRSSVPGAGSVTINTHVTNHGRLAWRGGDLVVNATLTNAASKMFDTASPMTIRGDGRLVNRGLFRRGGSPSQTTTIDINTDNTGRMYVLRGTLALGGSDASVPSMTNYSGTFATMARNAAVVSRAPTLHHNARFLGKGSYLFTDSTQVFRGDTTFANATFDDSAPLYISVSGARFLGNVDLLGNQIVAEGPLTIAGQTRMAGASLLGGLDVFVADVLTLDNASIDADVRVYSGGTLALASDSSIGGNLVNTGLARLDTATLSVAGSVLSSGTVATTVATDSSGAINAVGTITLGGTLRATVVATNAPAGQTVVVSGSARTGSFSSFQPLVIDSNLTASVLYTYNAGAVDLA